VTPAAGEVWELRCVGARMLFLIVDDRNRPHLTVLNLEDGSVHPVRAWQRGSHVGEWEKYA
jgi:hypothetical protein